MNGGGRRPLGSLYELIRYVRFKYVLCTFVTLRESGDPPTASLVLHPVWGPVNNKINDSSRVCQEYSIAAVL